MAKKRGEKKRQNTKQNKTKNKKIQKRIFQIAAVAAIINAITLFLMFIINLQIFYSLIIIITSILVFFGYLAIAKIKKIKSFKLVTKLFLTIVIVVFFLSIVNNVFKGNKIVSFIYLIAWILLGAGHLIFGLALLQLAKEKDFRKLIYIISPIYMLTGIYYFGLYLISSVILIFQIIAIAGGLVEAILFFKAVKKYSNHYSQKFIN